MDGGFSQQADWVDWVLHQTGARAVSDIRLLQQLWGGYGELLRIGLSGSAQPSVILKRVVPPQQKEESYSDLRKRRSYEVEQSWYRGPARHCEDCCRLARCLASETLGQTRLLLLEDLLMAGFRPARPPGRQQIGAGLTWLARFHARFLGARPEGLWARGNYWHLDTRPEEFRRMAEGPLKEWAFGLDRALQGARYQTLLHGDAKPANFCWDASGTAAAVDFQYVGPGCGIQDVAYFLDCCLDEEGCERESGHWLDFYFSQLSQALEFHGHAQVAEPLQQEWRGLFPVAWSDYSRFYQGWAPGVGLGRFSWLQLSLAQALLTAHQSDPGEDSQPVIGRGI